MYDGSLNCASRRESRQSDCCSIPRGTQCISQASESENEWDCASICPFFFCFARAGDFGMGDDRPGGKACPPTLPIAHRLDALASCLLATGHGRAGQTYWKRAQVLAADGAA